MGDYERRQPEVSWRLHESTWISNALKVGEAQGRAGLPVVGQFMTPLITPNEMDPDL